MSLRERTRPGLGIIEPCLPSPAKAPRSAIVCDENGLAVFELIRRHGALASAVHCAFDLLELDGKDLRRQPIEIRKHLLAKLLKGSHLSIVLNEHFEDDGAGGAESCAIIYYSSALWRRSARFASAAATRPLSSSRARTGAAI